MRRAAMLAVVGSVLLVAFAGVAYALTVQCDGTGDQDPDPGQCQGTEQSDFIAGTDVRDVIFALGGFDDVDARGGQDELNGQNGGDFLLGGDNSDTYNGGNGDDIHSDWFSFSGSVTNSGRDVMNAGEGEDFMEGATGADILRGQAGDECGGPENVEMFGDEGNDDLFGNAGEDCMEGDEGTDEHFGGADNDFIDAASQDPVGTPDVVDCGGGVDTAVVRRDEDNVRNNCENIIDLSSARVAVFDETTAEEQQQQREAFLVEHGLAPEPGG